jgi:hypothetical protein
MSNEETPLEYQKLLRDDARNAHQIFQVSFNSLNELSSKSSEVTLRTFVLINGGAAVSVLAFIGGLVGQGKIGVAQLGGFANSLT